MDNDREPIRPVLALHGFTLGGAMFAELAAILERPMVAPDLPGHGGRDATNTTWSRAVGEVIGVVKGLKPAVVLGYSMGGRLALAAALSEPALFPRLVLVSTSLGIADETERLRRLGESQRMAAEIEQTASATSFLEWFGAIPFLQAPGSSLDLMSIRQVNRAAGIAGALRGMDQGSQPYVGGELGRLTMPITWVAGSRDDKYTAIATEAAASCRDGELVIVDAGHNVVAEQPGAIAAIVGAG